MKKQPFSHKTPHLKGKQHQLDPNLDLKQLVHHSTVQYVNLKNAQHINREKAAAELVVKKLPALIQNLVSDLVNEYHQQTTPEAKFAKAMDKIQPVIYLYNEEGKSLLQRLQVTKSMYEVTKTKYVTDFQVLNRFLEVVSDKQAKEGFYFG